jgi:hypothetical protein
MAISQELEQDDDFVTLYIPVDLIPKEEDDWEPATKQEPKKPEVRMVK